MNDTLTIQRQPLRTLADPRSRSAGGDDPTDGSSRLQQAQETLRRSRDMRAEMERLLGGIELEDLRNGGGQ